jgi:hypothetical protein
MPRIEELEGIPSSDVEEVISDFESEGAQVEKILQEDGNWTVRARFPD